MKQKIVIKVYLPCDKCRTKAMEVVAKADGLISVAIAGDEKLEVIGDGIDPVRLVCHLRKKLCCYAEILQVEEVKDKKPAEEKKKPPEEPKKALPQLVVVPPLPQSYPGNCYCHGHHYHQPPPMMVCECEEPNGCAIM